MIAHRGVFDPHYSAPRAARGDTREGKGERAQNGKASGEPERPRYVGIPFSRLALEGEGAAFRLIEGPADISDCALLTGEVPRLTPFERVDPNLKVPDDGRWIQDEVFDDQAVVLRTSEGLVVALGCAHAGIVNTLEYARRIAGEERILAVIGGTHLGPAPKEQLEATIEALKGFGIARLGVSHCTGLGAAARLAQEFGDSFFFNTAGDVCRALASLVDDGDEWRSTPDLPWQRAVCVCQTRSQRILPRRAPRSRGSAVRMRSRSFVCEKRGLLGGRGQI